MIGLYKNISSIKLHIHARIIRIEDERASI
jgi:hypothetical protein